MRSSFGRRPNRRITVALTQSFGMLMPYPKRPPVLSHAKLRARKGRLQRARLPGDVDQQLGRNALPRERHLMREA